MLRKFYIRENKNGMLYNKSISITKKAHSIYPRSACTEKKGKSSPQDRYYTRQKIKKIKRK
jgi:hypothetical protein